MKWGSVPSMELPSATSGQLVQQKMATKNLPGTLVGPQKEIDQPTRYDVMYSEFSKQLQVSSIHLLDCTTLHVSPNVVVGSLWSDDPESYAGGSVAVCRASLVGKVKVDDPD